MARLAHRHEPRITQWVLSGMLFVVAGLLVWVVLKRGPQGQVAMAPRPVTPRADLTSSEQSTIALFRSTSPSVVHITSTTRGDLRFNIMEIPAGTGSGFIWDTAGHVVTNFHVIKAAQHIRVTLATEDNPTYDARLVGVAPDKDLAVLRIDAEPETLRPIVVGVSSDLEVGMSVMAIGNPFGLDQTLTTGVISGLGREITSVNQRPIQDVIQTDAAINPGNSGGPLLDSSGRLIGINTAIYSPDGRSSGIGFAVPVDTINRIVPQLIRNGRVTKPGLGVHIALDRVTHRYGIAGVLIIGVPPGSAAALAGLRGVTRNATGAVELGDIIVQADGKPVRSSDDLYRVLDRREVGDAIDLTVMRAGKEAMLTVTLQALE